MSRGIVIICLGHPYYGRMGHALAVTIKQSEPEIPIALIYNTEALQQLYGYDLDKVFDQKIEAPTEAYTTQGKNTYVKCKTFLYDLSPFDETLFIDADTLWLPGRKPSALFDELAPYDYTMANNEFFEVAAINHDTDVWGHIKPVKEAYGMTEGKYYSLSSEVIYFKKTEAVKAFFDTAKSVFENPKTKPKVFAGYIPDEYAFSVAQVITGMYPHTSPYHPSYWFSWHKNSKIYTPEQLSETYYIFSVGGKVYPHWIVNMYNRLVARAFYLAGLREPLKPWKLRSKRSFLPERSKI